MGLIWKIHVCQKLNQQIPKTSPLVLNMWLQTVKFIVRKSKCAGLAQEIGFPAPNSCTLQWLVKGAPQVWTSKKECNKLDLTAPQSQLTIKLDQSDWSIIIVGPGGVLLVVPTYMQFQLQFYWWGCQKKSAILKHLILLSKVTYRALVEML